MPGNRIFIGTNRAGNPVFIRRPSSHKSSKSTNSSSSSSGSYSRHRPSMSDERVHILREEMDRLRYSYEQVTRLNEIQKIEAQRMQRTLSEQTNTIHRLQHEMSNFRKESDIAANNATRYQSKYREAKSKNDDLERQNSDLGEKIRSLTRQLHVDSERRVLNLREQIEELKRNCSSKDRTLSRMRENLDARIEDCVALKADNTTLRRENDILRRSLETAKRLLARHGLYIP